MRMRQPFIMRSRRAPDLASFSILMDNAIDADHFAKNGAIADDNRL
jgi:hypothetical protein